AIGIPSGFNVHNKMLVEYSTPMGSYNPHCNIINIGPLRGPFLLIIIPSGFMIFWGAIGIPSGFNVHNKMLVEYSTPMGSYNSHCIATS
ncbi:hypothetical protein OQ279_08405, partial [Salinimicrobium sp. MT39]